MNKRNVILIIIALAAAAILVFFISSQSTAPNDPSSNSQSSQDQQVTLSEFTLPEVAQHDTKSDCWTVISGQVYDLTSYVDRHPGGDEVLKACGTDGTSLFLERKTDNGEPVGSGQPHSSGAKSQLSQYQIGVLK